MTEEFIECISINFCEKEGGHEPFGPLYTVAPGDLHNGYLLVLPTQQVCLLDDNLGIKFT